MSAPFVYRGAGRKQRADADATLRLCQDAACAIQWCLARSNNQEARCTKEIEKWRECCAAARAAEAAAAAAAAAPAAAAPLAPTSGAA